MSEAMQRGVSARVGIALLNLLAPGLGLLRVQKPRAAVVFLLAPGAVVLLVAGIYALTPHMPFVGWLTLMVALLVTAAAIYIIPLVISWRASRFLQPLAPWWSRWYGIFLALALVLAAGPFFVAPALSYYRTFYVPAEAMLPTLQVNDRFLASMRGPGELRRGDVILFDVGGATYVKRVAALPGDRIALEEGMVILNGQPVAQRFLGTDRVEPGALGTEARRLFEQFPGEAGPHQIYDRGFSVGDAFPEQLVAPGHVFVLGDNRDMSADSRFRRSEFGVEQLPIADIKGRALFYLWGPSDRMGEAINR